MTVGNNVRIKAKTLQGQVLPIEISKDAVVLDAKKMIATKLNEKDENTVNEADVSKIHHAQLRLTKGEVDLDDETAVRDIELAEDDFVYVFVGDASKVPINVRIHVFKGTGVDATHVDIHLGDNTEVLKQKLRAENFGPEDTSYTFFFKGRPLMDKKKIMDYGIEDGSDILLGVIMP